MQDLETLVLDYRIYDHKGHNCTNFTYLLEKLKRYLVFILKLMKMYWCIKKQKYIGSGETLVFA